MTTTQTIWAVLYEVYGDKGVIGPFTTQDEAIAYSSQLAHLVGIDDECWVPHSDPEKGIWYDGDDYEYSVAEISDPTSVLAHTAGKQQ